jgi:hypothetical protein
MHARSTDLHVCLQRLLGLLQLGVAALQPGHLPLQLCLPGTGLGPEGVQLGAVGASHARLGPLHGLRV